MRAPPEEERAMRKHIRCAVLSALLLATHALAQPAAYPAKPIRWLIPFAPGGGTDVIARPIAQKMSERLGQTIIYDNRGGGGGVVAGEIVARANPDGHTLLVAAVAVMTVTVSLVDKLPFDPVTDFAPITKFATVPNILVARPGFGPRTLQEIVDYARANPGKLTWASSGTGSAGMLTMELFRINNALKMVHVPYKGAGPATLGVLTNEADLLFANPGVFMGHIKAGRLRPVAVASASRISILPDVPTVHEMGFGAYENGSWYGLAAPAGTPREVIRRLHEAAVNVLKDPEILAGFGRDGASAVGNTPEQFAREIRDDIVKWAKIIKAANVKL
jgi:tripartite-type tricarboxylate transporter receptor subunit TctC